MGSTPRPFQRLDLERIYESLEKKLLGPEDEMVALALEQIDAARPAEGEAASGATARAARGPEKRGKMAHAGPSPGEGEGLRRGTVTTSKAGRRQRPPPAGSRAPPATRRTERTAVASAAEGSGEAAAGTHMLSEPRNLNWETPPSPRRQQEESAACLERQFSLMLEQFARAAGPRAEPLSPASTALRAPNDKLRDELGAVEQGSAELRLWDAVASEASALCSAPVRRLFQQLLARQRAHLGDLDMLVADVRRRLEEDWLLDSVSEKKKILDDRCKVRARELSEELQREIRASEAMSEELSEARERLRLADPATATAKPAATTAAIEVTGEGVLVHLPAPDSAAPTGSGDSDGASALVLVTGAATVPEEPVAKVAGTTATGAGASGAVTISDAPVPVAAASTSPAATSAALAAVAPSTLAAAQAHAHAQARAQAQTQAPMALLRSGSQQEGQLVSESRYFIFRMEDDDRGALVWFEQREGWSEHNFFEVCVGYGLPTSHDESLPVRQRVSTQNGPNVSLNLQYSDSNATTSSRGIPSGWWFVRVQARGSLLKSFWFELRVLPQLTEAGAPLGEFLDDIEAEMRHNDRLSSRLQMLSKAEMALQLTKASAERAAAAAAAASVQGAKNAAAPGSEAAIQYEVPEETDEEEDNGAGGARLPHGLDRSKATRKDGPAALMALHFLSQFRHPAPRLHEVVLFPLATVVRTINVIFAERSAADALVERSEGRSNASPRAQRMSQLPFPVFVYERFRNRYGLARLAERQLYSLLVSITANADPEVLAHPRVSLFAQFCGLIHRPRESGSSAPLCPRDLTVYLALLRGVQRICNEQSVKMSLDPADDGNVPTAVLVDAFHETLASRPRAWRLRTAQSVLAEAGSEQVNLDFGLQLIVEKDKALQEKYDETLRRLFALGDLRGEGVLTLEAFLTVMQRVDSGRSVQNLTRIFHEGVALSSPSQTQLPALSGTVSPSAGRASRSPSPAEAWEDNGRNHLLHSEHARVSPRRSPRRNQGPPTPARGTTDEATSLMTLSGLLRVGYKYLLLHRADAQADTTAAIGELVSKRLTPDSEPRGSSNAHDPDSGGGDAVAAGASAARSSPVDKTAALSAADARAQRSERLERLAAPRAGAHAASSPSAASAASAGHGRSASSGGAFAAGEKWSAQAPPRTRSGGVAGVGAAGANGGVYVVGGASPVSLLVGQADRMTRSHTLEDATNSLLSRAEAAQVQANRDKWAEVKRGWVSIEPMVRAQLAVCKDPVSVGQLVSQRSRFLAELDKSESVSPARAEAYLHLLTSSVDRMVRTGRTGGAGGTSPSSAR